MVKLIAIYSKPSDVAAFETHYREVHTPLARKLPGLRKLEISRAAGAVGGEPRYHMISEMYFDDMPALKAALKSPEGQAAGKDVMGFAGNILHMMFAEIEPG